jgi:23S rRNA (cytidine1920-2'-O)/16S rRNA (cytidine1409-2'-O)-methyltransferase
MWEAERQPVEDRKMHRIRADLLLVERGLFESRAKARAAIEAGGVTADGAPVTRAAQMLEADSAIVAEPAHRWVGRGALKLDHALSLWPVGVAGRVVMDLGASTGGFTEVCLERGAARVYAVDVGHGQLHPSLAADPRVVDLSGTDARTLDADTIAEPPSLIVCDASFISLTKLLPIPLSLAAEGGELIALVKPQFELAPADIGKGGLVRDADKRAEALAAVIAALEGLDWAVQDSVESPIRGGEGAVEFLLWARRE